MSDSQSILVTGSSGQLAQSLALISFDYPEYNFHFANRDQLDFTDPVGVDNFLQQHHFDVVINCAAYTAVDKAEQEAELADMVNHQAVKTLAKYAKQTEAVLIHISTDYVFDGMHCHPYTEQDKTSPKSVYGATKLKGEQAIQAVSPSGLIIRTSWLYSDFGHNFVKTMLRLGRERSQLKVVFDQVGTPTYATDLAKAIMQIIKHHDGQWPHLEQVPVYHYSNEGVCSWYDFANAIFELADIDCQVDPIATKDYPTPAQRPSYSLLNKYNIKHDFKLQIPYWRDSLKTCINQLMEKH